MSATVFTDVRIFSFDLGEDLESGDLLPTSNALIVFAETYEKNCVPHSPSWGLFFVGSESEFQNNMLPYMMDDFNDGTAQGSIASNGKALKLYLTNKLRQQRTISTKDFHDAGYIGFSFDQDQFNQLCDKEGYGGIKTYGENRFYSLINGEQDIKKLVKGVMDIRQSGEGQWWKGTPLKVRDYELHKIAV